MHRPNSNSFLHLLDDGVILDSHFRIRARFLGKVGFLRLQLHEEDGGRETFAVLNPLTQELDFGETRSFGIISSPQWHSSRVVHGVEGRDVDPMRGVAEE
ncbi:hypothetical protein DL765_005009 [Monosporascus sp. GIB2]|nr:hypothetical protein DL765_005009 [Monosporascus sp. GIB2]